VLDMCRAIVDHWLHSGSSLQLTQVATVYAYVWQTQYTLHTPTQFAQCVSRDQACQKLLQDTLSWLAVNDSFLQEVRWWCFHSSRAGFRLQSPATMFHHCISCGHPPVGKCQACTHCLRLCCSSCNNNRDKQQPPGVCATVINKHAYLCWECADRYAKVRRCSLVCTLDTTSSPFVPHSKQPSQVVECVVKPQPAHPAATQHVVSVGQPLDATLTSTHAQAGKENVLKDPVSEPSICLWVSEHQPRSRPCVCQTVCNALGLGRHTHIRICIFCKLRTHLLGAYTHTCIVRACQLCVQCIIVSIHPRQWLSTLCAGNAGRRGHSGEAPHHVQPAAH